MRRARLYRGAKAGRLKQDSLGSLDLQGLRRGICISARVQEHRPRQIGDMAALASCMSWKGDKLYYLGLRSDYSVVQDENYPRMWRVRRPDGSLSDMVNRARAKDAATLMLDRDLKALPDGQRRSAVA